MQWLRLHNKLLNDPVVQGLPASQFKTYINVLCYASSLNRGGYIGTLHETSFALRETIEHVTSCFIAFQGVGLIVSNVTDGETFQIPQWRKKQYESDSSTDRVKKHRERVKRSKNVTVTAPDTDTDTDTEQIQKKIKRSRFAPPTQQEAGNYFLERGSTQAIEEADKFVDFYASKHWMVGKNKMKDWKAAIRNWMRKSNETNKGPNGPSTKQLIGDALHGASANNW